MGANTFLDLGPLNDALRPVTHTIDLNKMGDRVYFKITLAAPSGNDQAYCKDRSPYTAGITADVCVSPDHLRQIQDGIADALRSLGL